MICPNIHKKQLPVIILHEILGRFPNISNSYHISEMLGPVFSESALNVFRFLFLCARAQISSSASGAPTVGESALSDYHPVVFVQALISGRRTINITNLRVWQ